MCAKTPIKWNKSKKIRSIKIWYKPDSSWFKVNVRTMGQSYLQKKYFFNLEVRHLIKEAKHWEGPGLKSIFSVTENKNFLKIFSLCRLVVLYCLHEHHYNTRCSNYLYCVTTSLLLVETLILSLITWIKSWATFFCNLESCTYCLMGRFC